MSNRIEVIKTDLITCVACGKPVTVTMQVEPETGGDVGQDLEGGQALTFTAKIAAARYSHDCTKPAPATGRRRGRPPGAKNKPKPEDGQEATDNGQETATEQPSELEAARV